MPETQTSLQTAKFTLKPCLMQRRKMLFPCKAHDSEFSCRQKLVVSTHKLQKNVSENADEPANCKIYVETLPEAMQKIFLSFARLMIVSLCADKNLLHTHKLQKKRA